MFVADRLPCLDLYGDWTTEGLNTTTGELEETPGTKPPATVPARLKSVPAPESAAKCPDCTEPLQPDGLCWFCGPKEKVMSW